MLRQPQRSWMAREAWVAGVFFPLALRWRCGSACPRCWLAAAIVGLLFLFCQAMILERGQGHPGLAHAAIVPLIIATGLAEGGGLFLLLAALLPALGAARQADGRRARRAGRDARLDLAALSHALESDGAPTRTLEVFDGLSARGSSPSASLLPVALIAVGLS